MGLIDTHCHLDMLKGTPGAALAEARAAGVEAVVTIGIDLRSSRLAAGLAARSTRCTRRSACTRTTPCAATRSLRPTSSGCPASHAWWPSASAAWTSTATSPRATSSGAPSSRRSSWRARLGKPLRARARGRRRGLRPARRARRRPQVVLHCFSPPEYVELQRARLLRLVRRQRHLQERGRPARGGCGGARRPLLVETDAPFLTPVPYRGTATCRPRRLDGPFLARLRGWSDDEVAAVTSANARRAFGSTIRRPPDPRERRPRTTAGPAALRPASPGRSGHARRHPRHGRRAARRRRARGRRGRRPADGPPRRAGALRACLRDRRALRRRLEAWRPVATPAPRHGRRPALPARRPRPAAHGRWSPTSPTTSPSR